MSYKYFCEQCRQYKTKKTSELCLILDHKVWLLPAWKLGRLTKSGRPVWGYLALLVVLLLGSLYPIRSVYAQTATPTPTPQDVNVVNFPTPYPFNYANNTATFIPLDYLQQGNGWIQPVFSLGLPDAQIATISAVGFYPLIADFEMNTRTYTGTYSGIKVDVIGKNFTNVSVYVQHNHSNIASCNGASLNSSEPAIGHHYFYYSLANCNVNPAWFTDHSLGIKLQYDIGVQTVTASVDSIEYIPVYTGGPYDSNVINVTNLNIPATPETIPQESCASGDVLCNLRNWLVDKINFFFGINTAFATDQFNILEAYAFQKIPWAYVNAMVTMDLSSPTNMATAGAAPDFTIASVDIPTIDINTQAVIHHYVTNPVTVQGSTYNQFNPFIAALRAGIALVLVAGWAYEMSIFIAQHLL